jgi:predicted GNAT superfamily acetyltransferase
VIIRDLTPADLDAAWAINQANTPAVGDVSRDKLAWIVEMASMSLVAEVEAPSDDPAASTVVGFCIVLPPGTEYTSVNYRWFCERYDSFVYLDRVAVDEAARGAGIGAALYAEVERRAAGTAELFTLEVNLRPRNDGSLRFHDRLGFIEVGQQETDYGILVSMLAKPL